MSKKVKILAIIFVVLMALLGGVYGLAKINVIPVQKMGDKTPALGSVLRVIGLYRPRPKVTPVQVAPDPLAAEKQELQQQRDEFKKEQTDWEAQKQAKEQAVEKARTTAAAAGPPAADPKQLIRLASIYEQMTPEAVNKIFVKLPDDQVIALLRRMDEKQVGEILAGVAPERAARLTQALSRPPAEETAPVRTAANTP
jgi:flagellar motility protein MotE (MotC chaperone)